MGAKTTIKPSNNPCRAAYNPTQHRGTLQVWPKRQNTKKWIPTNALTKQGHYEGTNYIWIPKNKKSQALPKQQKTSIDRHPTEGQAHLKWVPKGQKVKAAIEPRKEDPRQLNKLTTMIKKATALGKGKWVLKETSNTTMSYQEQLPSTSSNTTTETPTETTTTQRPN